VLNRRGVIFGGPEGKMAYLMNFLLFPVLALTAFFTNY
jgi:hypothetical protein